MEFLKDTNLLTALVSAIASLLAVVLGFAIKNRRQSIKHVETSWEGLIEDSAEYREEIRQDLLMIKEERDRLKSHIFEMEKKIEEVIKDNMDLKMRELELIYEIKLLKQLGSVCDDG